MPENLELKNKLIHHRGLRIDQPKPNSLDGVYYEKNTHLECDVFLLSDGQLAIIHNKDLGISSEEVESWTKEEAIKREVPLFKEFILANLKQQNTVTIEHKASSPEIAKKLVEATINTIHQLREEGYFKDHPEYPNKCLYIHSFSIDCLEYAAEVMDQTGEYFTLEICWPSSPDKAFDMAISKTGLARSGYQDNWTSQEWQQAGIKIARQLKCTYIHIFKQVINKELVDFAHNHGLKVALTGLFTETEQYQDYFSLGIDKIITEV